MEKAKYLPEEIERIIDEEISRIDAANTVAAAADGRSRSRRRPWLSRLLGFLLGKRSRTPHPGL